MKKIIVVLFVIVTLISVYFAACNRTDGNLKNYMDKRNKIAAEDMMPELDSLPAYESITYRYQGRFRVIYDAQSILLVVTYDEDTYAEEKEEIEKQYVFLSKESFEPGYKDALTIPEYEFSINSFSFHVIDSSGSMYPKFFGMIATSDQKHSVAYLYYNDVDLDYIDHMTDFVHENYAYRW